MILGGEWPVSDSHFSTSFLTDKDANANAFFLITAFGFSAGYAGISVPS